jgi:hypothetical protein
MAARVLARIMLFAIATAMTASAAENPYTPPTSDAFLKAIRSYPFVAAADRREKISAAVPRITLCMPAADVRRLIGDPDFGLVAFKSGTQGKVPAMKLWHYVLEKKAATETEPGSRITVWLDRNERIQGVTVHGAPDIESTVSRRSQVCA